MRYIERRIVVVLLSALPGSAQSSTPTEAVVEFRVTDRFLRPPTDRLGRPVEYRCESFKLSNGSIDATDRFVGLRGDGIPKGTSYSYLLTPKGRDTGAPDISGQVSILEAYREINVTADSFAHSPPIGLSGVVTAVAAASGEPIWVRLHPLFDVGMGDVVRDAKLDQEGRFLIADAEPGEFLVIVFDGVKPIAAKEITIGADAGPSVAIAIDRYKDRISTARPKEIIWW